MTIDWGTTAGGEVAVCVIVISYEREPQRGLYALVEEAQKVKLRDFCDDHGWVRVTLERERARAR